MRLGVPGEKRLVRKGGHYCVRCAGPAYKNGHVVDPATRLVTAVADGCRAAQAAARYIARLGKQ